MLLLCFSLSLSPNFFDCPLRSFYLFLHICRRTEMFFVLLLRRAPKWFTALECDECNVGRGRGIGKGDRKRGRCDWGPATIGLLLDLGSYHTETAKKRMEEELSTLYLLSTANNVMCRWVAGTGVWHAPSLLLVGATSCWCRCSSSSIVKLGGRQVMSGKLWL